MVPVVRPPELPHPDPGDQQSLVWAVLDLLAATLRNIREW